MSIEIQDIRSVEVEQVTFRMADALAAKDGSIRLQIANTIAGYGKVPAIDRPFTGAEVVEFLNANMELVGQMAHVFDQWLKDKGYAQASVAAAAEPVQHTEDADPPPAADPAEPAVAEPAVPVEPAP